MNFCFEVGGFLRESPVDLDLRKIAHFLHALTRINEDFIRRNPSTPKLEHSGIRYDNSRNAFEYCWRDYDTMLAMMRRGVPFAGICRDLAAVKAAEYRAQGIDAHVILDHHAVTDSVWEQHVLVQLPGGVLVDPSKQLGMR